MNDLNATIADLATAGQAYYDRAAANGSDHPDNDYLLRQGSRFVLAAQFLGQTITAAADQATKVEVLV